MTIQQQFFLKVIADNGMQCGWIVNVAMLKCVQILICKIIGGVLDKVINLILDTAYRMKLCPVMQIEQN